jgi:hypothetical protein
MHARHRRGLVGLTDTPRPSTTPVEIITFKYEGIIHIAAKQTQAVCVGGIDNWWLTTCCGRKLVVTSFAEKFGDADCMACITMSM